MWNDVEQIITDGMDVHLGSLQNVEKSDRFFGFTWTWESLRFALWDLEKMLGPVICLRCSRSFYRKLRETLSNPKCRWKAREDQFCCYKHGA